jgi:hypothetical protein
VIDGRQAHVDWIAGRLRAADRAEVFAATGENPDVVLYRSWITSVYRWSIVHRGEIIGLFGLAPAALMGDTGVPWLLGTDALENIKLSFVKQSIRFVGQMLLLYPVLANWVDARNTLSVKWLKRLGFVLSAAPQPYGFEQRPFYYFEKRR